MSNEEPDNDPYGECAAEIRRLTTAVAQGRAREQKLRELLLGVVNICDEWKPDYSTGDERRAILLARNLLTGINTPEIAE